MPTYIKSIPCVILITLFTNYAYSQPEGFFYVGHINEYNVHKDLPKDRISNRGYLIGLDGSISKNTFSPFFGFQFLRTAIPPASITTLFKKETQFLDKFGFRFGLETPIFHYKNMVLTARGLVSAFQIIDYDEDSIIARGAGLPVESSYHYSFGGIIKINAFSLSAEWSTQFQDNYPDVVGSKQKILTILVGFNF